MPYVLGHVYAFNIPVNREIKTEANSKSVPIIECNVIYKLIDTLKEELSKKMPPRETEDIIGK